MDKFLRPGRFDAIPNARGSDKAWLHWKKTFTNFLTSIAEHEPNSLNVLINYVSPEVFEYIADYTDYDSALEIRNLCTLHRKMKFLLDTC